MAIDLANQDAAVTECPSQLAIVMKSIPAMTHCEAKACLKS